VLAVTISLISAAQGNQIFIQLNYLNKKLTFLVIRKVGQIYFQSYMFFFLVAKIVFKSYENDDFLLISIISRGRITMKQSNVWPQFLNTEFRWIIIQNKYFCKCALMVENDRQEAYKFILLLLSWVLSY